MGTPFKMKSGNTPLRETTDWFNVRGYLKGEQGLIPDYKGKSTAETATNVSNSIQKGHGKVKQVVKNMLSPKVTTLEKKSSYGFSKEKRGLKKEGKLMKDSMKKVAKPSKKSTITDNTTMKPPYKKPVGPRAN